MAREKLTEPTTDIKWEKIKETAIPIVMGTAHQAIALFNKTERTISDIKYPGIQLWAASTVVLAEWGVKRTLIPLTSFETLIPE